MSMTPREHIDHLRKTKFSIGGELNPLTEDLHQAVKNLSGELYAKDVHFFMELIQNAEDNVYSEGVNPSLEFVITSCDITRTGAPSTLLVFNNEKGFSSKNIDSICSVGRSTKKGNRKDGYIGEKGIGFKSVFLICARPYIFSNGYQIRFSEEPCVHCNVGYIVPEWVEQNPTLCDIKKIYGSGALPTTTLILPLKPDKVNPVKQQLSSIHPEVLLFLSKIRQLSVREDNEDPRLKTVNAIKIASETNFKSRKNIDAQSSTLHLSAQESNVNDSGRECSYYMWKQKFPVRQEFRVERRMEVDEWVITLAFPFGERLRRTMNSSPGVYAFLPTEMVTNFPFIIQADFLLASSRETILLDNKWNRGILQCVPTAFVNAFTCLVKSEQGAPVANLPPMFRFLPVQISPYPELNVVRDAIKAKLVEEDIIPVEPEIQQRFFHKPREVGRLMPAFWKILMKAKDKGLSLINISSHGKSILSYSFDNYTYDHILIFLGVDPVNDEWYVRCIQGTSKLVEGVSEDVYLELLLFISDNWSSMFSRTNMKNIPLIKCADYGNKSLCNISSIQSGECRVCLSSQSSQVSWLIDCNREFISVTRLLFMPKATQDAIWSFPKKDTLKKWLVDQVKVGSVDVNYYAVDLLEKSLSERKLVDAYVHFLYHSWYNNFISVWEVRNICKTMPLVDDYGRIVRSRSGIIVPANGSKWAGLTNSNLWRKDGYVELGDLYMDSGHFSGKFTPQKKLLKFLVEHADAKDVPDISAPSDGISLSAPLTKENSFLLLNWIRQLKYKRATIPHKFLTSIKEGSWLRVTLNGSPGYRPPSQSFLLTSSWGNSLQSGSVFVDIPLIDKSFYGESISDYKEELKTIGVMFEYSEACQFIGNHLMSLAASSSLTRGNVYSILHFIKFLREKCLSPVDFIDSIEGGHWLKTSLGYRSPVGSVLSDDEWNVASKVSNIPFVDKEFYGEEICNFRTELQLLGVVVSFSNSFQLIIDNLKSPSSITWTPEVILLLLKCLNLSNSSHKLLDALKGVNCLKTNIGYKCPGECLLFHPEWGCILQIFTGLPLIDHDFYGSSIFSYRHELKKTGVVVDFEEAAIVFARYFRQYASSRSITKENAASFLSCYRKLKGDYKFPADLKSCLADVNVKWLRTRLGDYRSPRECILYSPEWESISTITLLPFIDDSDSCYGKSIHEFKKELKSLGVVVEFKEGIKFVTSGLYFPQEDSSCITPENALALLECIKILMEEKGYSFPDAFRRKVSSHSWLKTHAGYRSPGQTLLFDSKFGLKQTDGPFIDEKYYGSKIVSYRKQLSEIGVIVEAEKGCPLIASHLVFHDEKEAFIRMYSYLSRFKWEPDTDDLKRIWIRKGEWVQPDECVIYDKDGLFGLQLTVLEKYFEQNLLVFFSIAFRVKSHPSVDDYLKLWKVWESSESPLSPAQCSKFWSYISKHWHSKTENTLADDLLKVPVYSGSCEIFLRNKSDVFIANDLQLKYLFDRSSPESIFVWYPQPSMPSLPRSKLLDIYKRIGVRTISESVQMEEMSLGKNVEMETFPREKLIAKALLRLILGFLASPTIEMEAKKRHEAVQSLVNVMVVVTTERITVRYKLPLSSGKVLNVNGSQKIRFDRERSKIYTQKIDKSGGSKSVIKFATFFSEAISESVLWDSTDHIEALSELIKLAFVLDFDEEAVEFLMKSKNLQVFMEDEEFLKSV